jgi:hypothetical protein
VAGPGLVFQFLREAGGTEQPEPGVCRVVPRPGEQVAEMAEPAQFAKPGTPVAVLGFTDERDRSSRRARPGTARQGENVDFVPGLVLPAGDDCLPDRANGKAGFGRRIPSRPLSGKRFEVRSENLGFDGMGGG